MLGVSVKEVREQLFANSLSLAVDSDTDSQEVNGWERSLAESRVNNVANREYRVADDCLGVSFPSNNDLINSTFVEFFHDELGVRLAAALKSLLVHGHELWKNLGLILLSLFDELNLNIVRLIGNGLNISCFCRGFHLNE